MTNHLNDITLSPGLLASLYKNVLIEEPSALAATEPLPQVASPGIRFLGNNSKHVLVLVRNEAHIFLPEDQLEFLTRILGACKLNMGDVAIVNMAARPPLASILEQFRPAFALLFDGELEGSDLPGVATAVSRPIEELLPDTPHAKSLKSRLWATLKQMFAV